jgi:hypothetical protein
LAASWASESLGAPRTAPEAQIEAPETLSAESSGRPALQGLPSFANGPQSAPETPETLSAEAFDDPAFPLAIKAFDAPQSPIAPETTPTTMVAESFVGQNAAPAAHGWDSDGGCFEEPISDPLWYGRLDYLYWEATDPKRRAAVFVTNSTSESSPNFDQQINLADPNTDHEMGLRFWFGRRLTGTPWAFEVAGLWVYPTDFIELYTAGIQQGGIFGGITIDTVTFAPTGEPADVANLSYRTRYWGTELNGRWTMVQGGRFDFDAIAGVRYLDYAERLAFKYRLVDADAPVTERFETNNHMIGGQIGGDLRTHLCNYVAFLTTGRAGLLGNLQNVDVKGPPPGLGRMTNSSNLGVTDQTDVSVLLEFNAGVEFLLTPDVSVVAGYSGIWLNHQLRSPEQVDLAQSFPGGRPVVSLATDSIWLQGFTLSLTARW